METPTRYYSITVPKTRRHASTNLFKSHYTVSSPQLYEVRLNFPSDYHIALKRYREFHILKSGVCFTQVYEKSVIPLPDFPSKKLLPMNSKVVEIRREMLETWLQAVIQQELLLPLVFKFLDLSISRISFVMNMVNSVSTPADDAIVLDLAAQLSSEARQKLKTLKFFDKAFFEHQRRLTETALQTLMAHLLPLCADLIVGAKSIYILSKLLSPQHNRDCELIRQTLVRENSELLASMDLQRHICQEFSGDTSQHAFEILLVLHDYYERSCQGHTLFRVLNYNVKAFEVFKQRKIGAVDIKELRRNQTNSDWVSVDDEQFPSISLKYKMEDGTSFMHGSVIVNSTVEDLLSVLTSLENRTKWDMFFEGGKVIERISESEFTVLFRKNFEYGKICYIFKCTVKRFSPTCVSFTLVSATLPDAIIPPGYELVLNCRVVYTIEALSKHKPLKSTISITPLSEDQDFDHDDIKAADYSDVAVLPCCIMTCELEQVKNPLAFTTAALEGRLILQSWSRLKAMVENQDLVGSRSSVARDTLQDIVQRKQLKPTVK